MVGQLKLYSIKRDVINYHEYDGSLEFEIAAIK